MSMNIRTAAARIPRASMRHPQLPLGRRSVGGAGQHTAKDDKSTKSNFPLLAGGTVVLVGAVTYAVGKSAWGHGENIANEAREVPAVERVGKPPGSTQGGSSEPSSKSISDATQRSVRSDSPKSAYKAEEQEAPKNLPEGVSQQEVSGSIKQGLNTDAPKTAYKAEEKGDAPSGNRGSKSAL